MGAHSRTYWEPNDYARGICDVHDGPHLWSYNPEDPCIGWNEYQGRHARRPETMLVYVEWRALDVVVGYVVRGEGDDAREVEFEVEDNEPDDVWGPILSRIAEDLGLNGSPEHCDGAELTIHNIEGVKALLELRHDGTPS